MTEPPEPPEPTDHTDPPVAADVPGPEGEDVQVAFDLGELPGGAKGAIEAVLMVIEEPEQPLAFLVQRGGVPRDVCGLQRQLQGE